MHWHPEIGEGLQGNRRSHKLQVSEKTREDRRVPQFYYSTEMSLSVSN
jgi:hypothetical protein